MVPDPVPHLYPVRHPVPELDLDAEPDPVKLPVPHLDSDAEPEV
jgi:hypothetical protein